MSRASVQRLMRVNQLEEPLKKMVDKKELPLDTAEQISHMKPAEQKTLADAIEKRAAKSLQDGSGQAQGREPRWYADPAEDREVGSAYQAGD